MPLSEMARRQWPNDRPLPTEEEIAKATERLHAQEKSMRDDGYCGDWGMSLDWVMCGYGPVTWWHLFFPDDPHPSHELFKGLGFYTNTHAKVTK